MAELALLNDPVCCCILMTCAKIVHSGGDYFRVRCSMDVERRGAMPKVLHRCRIYYECVRCYYFHIHKLACSVVVDCSFSRFPNEASPYIVVPKYLPAAPTSAKFLTCFSSVVVSYRQKQSVSDAFQNVVLPPSSAPTSFEVARRELADKVQLLALVGGDGAFLVVVFPRSEHQQSPFCAGIKLFALWFCQWCEAVFNQHDGG